MTYDPPSRRRPLTADEAELWQHAMRQAKALRRRDRAEQKASARADKAAGAGGRAEGGAGDGARRKAIGRAGVKAGDSAGGAAAACALGGATAAGADDAPSVADEAELWQHVMRQAKVLRRRDREERKATERAAKAGGVASGGSANPGRDADDGGAGNGARRNAAGNSGAESAGGGGGNVAGTGAASAPSRTSAPGGRHPVAGGAAGRTPVNAPPPLSQFDERQRRRLAKDADLIEARLDLHGMRQLEAHGALRAFLRSSAARGVRHALVITGKGAPEGNSRDFMQGEGRGVLRRLVPQWLGESEMRGVVVSYTAAHARHGGEGALYVRLRKAPPPR